MINKQETLQLLNRHNNKFKILSNDFDIDDIVNKIKDTQIVTINDYRLLTGACQQGIKMFMNDFNLTENSLPLNKTLTLTKNYFGYHKFKKLFE